MDERWAGLEAVRQRPGMYIGDLHDGSGLHHMLDEVVNNSLGEAWAGHCDSIKIELNANGWATVRDNGRGIPTHTWQGESVPVIVMTMLHSGGKFGVPLEETPAVLRGVGVAVVNALSEVLNLRIWREGKEHFIRFRRGRPEAPLALVGATCEHGTEVSFLPDAEIFGSLQFNFDTINRRIRSLSHLKLGVTLSITDNRPVTPVSASFEV